MSEAGIHAELGVRAWEAFLRAHAGVVPRVARQVETATGIPLSWYDVLLELTRSEGSELRMADLGELVVLSRSRVSRVVDAMVEAGLVEKVPDPEDGRATLARLTRDGRKTFHKAVPIYLGAIEQEFAQRFTATELAALVGLLNRLDRT